jgi:hypothetical protein
MRLLVVAVIFAFLGVRLESSFPSMLCIGKLMVAIGEAWREVTRSPLVILRHRNVLRSKEEHRAFRHVTVSLWCFEQRQVDIELNADASVLHASKR